MSEGLQTKSLTGLCQLVVLITHGCFRAKSDACLTFCRTSYWEDSCFIKEQKGLGSAFRSSSLLGLVETFSL